MLAHTLSHSGLIQSAGWVVRDVTQAETTFAYIAPISKSRASQPGVGGAYVAPLE